MNILANVGIVIIIVVVPSSLTTFVVLNTRRRLGDDVLGFVELVIFYGFCQGKSPSNYHLGEYFWNFFQASNMKIQVWVRKVGVLVSQTFRKCQPKIWRKDSGIMVLIAVIPSPRTKLKRGHPKRKGSSPNHPFFSGYLLVSGRVRPYKGIMAFL